MTFWTPNFISLEPTVRSYDVMHREEGVYFELDGDVGGIEMRRPNSILSPVGSARTFSAKSLTDSHSGDGCPHIFSPLLPQLLPPAYTSHHYALLKKPTTFLSSCRKIHRRPPSRPLPTSECLMGIKSATTALSLSMVD